MDKKIIKKLQKNILKKKDKINLLKVVLRYIRQFQEKKVEKLENVEMEKLEKEFLNKK